MARKTITFDDLMKLAKRYGLETNEFFISCANQYDRQAKIIEKMSNEIDTTDLLCTKEYVKGRENIMANPLIKELPKHTDSANKTLGMMLNIISTLGVDKPTNSKLDSFLND